MYLLSGLCDLVVPFLKAVGAIIQIEQGLVLALLALEQRTVAPRRHDLLDLLHVVLRVLHSFLQIVNFVSVKVGTVTSKIFTCLWQCCIFKAYTTYDLFTYHRCRFWTQFQPHSCTWQYGWVSESDTVQCQKFCTLQCSLNMSNN